MLDGLKSESGGIGKVEDQVKRSKESVSPVVLELLLPLYNLLLGEILDYNSNFLIVPELETPDLFLTMGMWV